jgi:hypothetical protein
VTDAVRHVAEQELLASAHAGVADDQCVDAVLFRDAEDRACGIVVRDDARSPPGAGDLGRELLQRLGGERRSGRLGLTALGRPRVRREDHLEEEEFGVVAIRERGRPSDGAIRRLRTVGRDHHAPDPCRCAGPVSLCHLGRIMTEGFRARH